MEHMIIESTLKEPLEEMDFPLWFHDFLNLHGEIIEIPELRINQFQCAKIKKNILKALED